MSKQPVLPATSLEIAATSRTIGTKDGPRLYRIRGTRWRHFRRTIFRNRHTCLFIGCLIVYLGVPLLEEAGNSLLIEDLFTLGLMLTSLLVLSQFRVLKMVGITLSGVLIVSSWLEHYFFLAGFNLIEGLLLPAFYGTVLIVVVGNLLREREISLDHILGAIAGYFVLGFFWAEIYDLLLLFNPSAISSTASSTLSKSQMFYFSFSTLVTIGYGDIVPNAGMARNTAVLEGISGQLYLAILIARLVGLHLHHTVNGRLKRTIT